MYIKNKLVWFKEIYLSDEVRSGFIVNFILELDNIISKTGDPLLSAGSIISELQLFNVDHRNPGTSAGE